MSDYLMAIYDEERNAVVIRLQSGSEVAVMDCDEADGFADEVKAASRKESTGYEEFLAQEDLPEAAETAEEKTSEESPFVGEFQPSEQTCPQCAQPRPYAIDNGTFLPDSACPRCGHTAGEIESEQGNYLYTLTSEGDITVRDNDGNHVATLRLEEGAPEDSDDWDRYASVLGLSRINVTHAVNALILADDDGDYDGDYDGNTVVGAPAADLDEQALLDADDALRAAGEDVAFGPCVITDLTTEDDCTNHDHEPPSA